MVLRQDSTKGRKWREPCVPGCAARVRAWGIGKSSGVTGLRKARIWAMLNHGRIDTLMTNAEKESAGALIYDIFLIWVAFQLIGMG